MRTEQTEGVILEHHVMWTVMEDMIKWVTIAVKNRALVVPGFGYGTTIRNSSTSNGKALVHNRLCGLTSKVVSHADEVRAHFKYLLAFEMWDSCNACHEVGVCDCL